jgi:hypothetical protein
MDSMTEDFAKYKLVVLPVEKDGYDHAKYIPKYGIEKDFQYFTMDSLVRMYGVYNVAAYLRTQGYRVEIQGEPNKENSK